jgi:hypothetical protein
MSERQFLRMDNWTYKKHCQPLNIFHKGLKVSVLLSPKTIAKIPAAPLFTAVHSHILFFFYRPKSGVHQFVQFRVFLSNQEHQQEE